jgi:hypothetical protein
MSFGLVIIGLLCYHSEKTPMIVGKEVTMEGDKKTNNIHSSSNLHYHSHPAFLAACLLTPRTTTNTSSSTANIMTTVENHSDRHHHQQQEQQKQHLSPPSLASTTITNFIQRVASPHTHNTTSSSKNDRKNKLRFEYNPILENASSHGS